MSGLILPHQRKIFDQLLAAGQAYFAGGWQGLPIKPRWARLLVAPTGVGKSHLVRAVASACGAQFFPVSFGSWIPTGCSRQQGRQTAQSLVETLVEHPRTVLMVDEIDKITEETSWTTYLRTELYSVLDGQWPAGTIFADETDLHANQRETLARRRLKFGCWIVGIGTWQNLWDRRTGPRIGFQEPETDAALELDELAGTIPRETLNRFSSSVVVMAPMVAADYYAAVAAAARELPDHLQDRFYGRASERVPAAVHNRGGCRFLEEVLAQILIEDSAALLMHAPDIEPL